MNEAPSRARPSSAEGESHLAARAPKFPFAAFAIALIVTASLPLGMGWVAYVAYDDAKHFRDVELQLEREGGVIVHLDEALTMSARMAAATGDLQWETRYLAFEPKLDAAIKEAIRLSPGAAIAIASTDEANQALVAMEHKSFDLIREGNADEARAILFGPEYIAQKENYAKGITETVANMHSELDASFVEATERALISMGIAVVATVIAIYAWGTAIRRMREWRRALMKETQDRARAEDTLRGVNEGLEATVTRRTGELRLAAEASAKSERFAMLGSLSAGVAHEINNPLTFMNIETDAFSNAVESLPPGSVPGDFRATASRFVATNKQGIERIARIVQSLRTISKPEARTSLVPIAQIVDATVTLSHSSLRGRNVTVDIPPDLAAFATADHVAQISLNLVMNAADAVPLGKGRIVISARSDGQRTVIRFQDNGHGISEETKARLFEPFYTTKKKGTGLGLATCRRLAGEAGGTLRFEDTPGGGTTFILDLPSQPPPPLPTSLTPTGVATQVTR